MIVRIKDPVPVFIIYYTAWVGDDGRLHFRDDVYDHDKDLVKKMFTTNPPDSKLVRVDNLKVSTVQ